jgi:RNA polymerase sigma factor (sigma-70 family)
MGDPGTVAALLDRLRSVDAPAAWEEFLREYSQILYQTARFYTFDPDAAADCYLSICQHLAANSFRRLLKFNPEGKASFTTWLRVVARNVCLDWHRSQSGRRRALKALQSLSQLECEVYDCRFEHGLSEEETLQRLHPLFPDLSRDQLGAIELRIERSLTSRQRWTQNTRQKLPLTTQVTLLASDGWGESSTEIADTRSNQESVIATQEQEACLKKCVASLSADERLLLQLRFEEDLSLDEIARLTGRGDAQRVHRHIAAVLKKLRTAMG